ncbi:MAG TPA: hypothetical protein VGM92_15275 [Candidatus Kapabacteria bacterium]|jgi:hypothetical protein
MKENLDQNNRAIEAFCAIARLRAEEFLRECNAHDLAPTYAYFTIWLGRKSVRLGLDF